MYKEDPSDTGDNIKLYFTALLATEAEKDQIWKEFFNGKTQLTYPKLFIQMEGYNHGTIKEDTYYEKFFEKVDQIFENREVSYAQGFFNKLFPLDDNLEQQLHLVNQLSKKQLKNQFAWEKALKEKRHNLQQRITSYQLTCKKSVFP